jgi:hypothetical protein
MNKIIIAFIFIVSCYFNINNDVYGDDFKINKIEAIGIAENEAKRLKFDVDSMNMEISLWNTSTNKYLPYESVDDYSLEQKNKLKDKVYWAVYLNPRLKGNLEKDGFVTVTLGGDICIFIDAHTGEILAEIRGK